MKTLLLLVAVLFVPGLSAEEARIPLVHPKSSELVLSRVTTKNEHYAEFEGRTVVSGTLFAFWHSSGSQPDEFKLIPDKSSAATLPHFARYRVKWIDVKNGANALERSMSRADYRKVMAKNGPLARVTGTWEITDYAVGIECDAPYAQATVVRLLPPSRQVVSVKAPETC